MTERTVKQIKGLIMFAVITAVAGANWRLLLGFIKTIYGLFSPFIAGACIAFVLNVLMQAVEKRLTGIRKPALRRTAGIVLTLLLVIGFIAAAIVLVIPEIINSVRSLQVKVPAFFAEASLWLEAFLRDNPELLETIAAIEADWEAIVKDLQNLLANGAGSILSGSVTAAKGIAGAAFNVGIALIFSVYILFGKEKLYRQFLLLADAVMKEERKEKLLYVLKLASGKFTAFITGQCLEACILGLMFFVSMSILRLPYAVLIGVLIAFTALIPVFGAFIGFFIGVFLMLLQSPVQALVFTGLFLVLQQVEGNLIYPHVVGGSVELPAIWVFVAVTVGGSAFGIAGMLFFIPLFSVFYVLIREAVYQRCREKEEREKIKKREKLKETDEA